MELFSMCPSKAPGVDGFNVGLYKKHCGSIGEDVKKVILGFLNGEFTQGVINKTVTVLIPKVKNPQNITNTDWFLFAMLPIIFFPKF